MSTYQELFITAQAASERGILALAGLGLLVAAGWLILDRVPDRWRGIAEIAYLVSVAALYAAVLIVTEAAHV